MLPRLSETERFGRRRMPFDRLASVERLMTSPKFASFGTKHDRSRGQIRTSKDPSKSPLKGETFCHNCSPFKGEKERVFACKLVFGSSTLRSRTVATVFPTSASRERRLSRSLLCSVKERFRRSSESESGLMKCTLAVRLRSER